MNWFPLGVSYALLYMGRYNLTVAKNSLGDLMTKEDFGYIFGAGALVYAFAFLFNGPLVDRIGGRRGMLIGAAGAMLANVAMAVYLQSVLSSGRVADAPLRTVFSVLYAVNMYFQSYGAVSIVKINANWFHVRERGGFSGIFGTMIASGIFLAFTVNDWLLGLAQAHSPSLPKTHTVWVVFAIPAALLGLMFVIELLILRDKPSEAGFEDFDTGDGDGPDTGGAKLSPIDLYRRIFTNRVIMTIALIELCTGVLRNGVMQWFPIYAKEIWALPDSHLLRNGSWENLPLIGICFAVAAVSGVLASLRKGGQRAVLAVLGTLAFLVPFFQGGWGGLLMVAGVIGGNVAGWVSDLFFQSRRGPAAAGLYGFLILCVGAMVFVLATPPNVVATAQKDSGLLPGDTILAVGVDGAALHSWADVRTAISCWEPTCKASQWDPTRCTCSTAAATRPPVEKGRPIPLRVVRDGATIDVQLKDPKATQEAGDLRLLKASPVLPLSPWALGAIVFMISICVIGTHGVLSGTATMDFGGKRGAATAVGVIDGFVYLGSSLQSVALGYLTTRSWSYWPIFLVPFAIIGFLLALRIWSAKPRG